jgi:hypothetical protein
VSDSIVRTSAPPTPANRYDLSFGADGNVMVQLGYQSKWRELTRELK